MRADRLVAILLMLQTRGQVTAVEVATELEISERTARRDLDSLGVAGLPVYSVQGRNGGWRLLGDGRTDLSGLTSTETQALFLLAGPRATTPELRAALRKLVRALPEPFRERAEAASAAVVHDATSWSGSGIERPTPVHLDAVQSAVIAGRQIVLGYIARAGVPTTRTVHPLGLATKSGSWYLVAETDAGRRTFRVDRIQSVEITDDLVIRPDGFELADAWQMITTFIEVLEPATVRSRLAVIAAELSALYAGTAASANSAIDVNRHVGDTSPDGVAVAPVPPSS